MARENINKASLLKQMINDSHEYPLVVVFTATWISQSGIVDIITKKIKTASPDINLLIIDADADEELVNQYNISQLPSAVIIKNQRIMNKINGTFSKKNILDKL
jgi:thioredoxin-like negative regulator of GroEL